MTIKEQISADFLVAYKEKDMVKKNFLGVVKGAIDTNAGKGLQPTDENVLKVIKSIEKGVNETIENLKKEGLDTSVQEKELSYLKPYQPTLMSEDELRSLAKDIVAKAEHKNIGFLMGTFNKENHGKAFDNRTVNNIFKELIA